MSFGGDHCYAALLAVMESSRPFWTICRIDLKRALRSASAGLFRTIGSDTSRKRLAVIACCAMGWAADLTSPSRQLVQDWAVREGIDIATSRATDLLNMWHSLLPQERAKRRSEKVRA